MAAMSLLDALRLALRKPVVGRLAEEKADVLIERKLVAFGNQQVVAPCSAGSHGIRRFVYGKASAVIKVLAALAL